MASSYWGLLLELKEPSTTTYLMALSLTSSQFQRITLHDTFSNNSFILLPCLCSRRSPAADHRDPHHWLYSLFLRWIPDTGLWYLYRVPLPCNNNVCEPLQGDCRQHLYWS